MKLIFSDRPHCELRRGEARRVPQEPHYPLVGYYVACLHCGFTPAALNGDDGLTIIESDDRTEITFSKPIRCPYCRVRMTVTMSDCELIRDEHVRNVRYR